MLYKLINGEIDILVKKIKYEDVTSYTTIVYHQDKDSDSLRLVR